MEDDPPFGCRGSFVIATQTDTRRSRVRRDLHAHNSVTELELDVATALWRRNAANARLAATPVYMQGYGRIRLRAQVF